VEGESDVYTMTDLEQVKVLADPLRVRILEALCGHDRTTKQVAEVLGEKPTRLYHHVEALERVGLIRLVDTRQVRGTVEKYYSAIAKMFRADPRLFQTADETGATDAIGEVVDTMMSQTTRDLQRLIDSGHDLSGNDDAVLSYIELRGTEEDLREVRDTVMSLLEQVERNCCREDLPEDARRFRLTLALFPLDP